MNKWQQSSGCLLLLPHCQLPIHHSLTLCIWVCVCVCVCVWRRKRRRKRREEEERTSEATVQVPHPSFCKTRLHKEKRGKGREVMFSQNDSLLPSPFPREINEAKRGLRCFSSTARNSSVSLTNNRSLFCPTLFSTDRQGAGREREWERVGGGGRQDRTGPLV